MDWMPQYQEDILPDAKPPLDTHAHTAFDSQHWSTPESQPQGGCSYGVGFTISWQHGPLVREGKRYAPNGAFVEAIVGAAVDRLVFYQHSPYATTENDEAIEHLQAALRAMHRRTDDRVKRQVEGTYGK